MAIAKNIPLNEVINWLVSLAPTGLIEFVPKNDLTIINMLELKGDIFPNYTIENFENALRNIPKTDFLPNSGFNVYDIIRRNFLVISLYPWE